MTSSYAVTARLAFHSAFFITLAAAFIMLATLVTGARAQVEQQLEEWKTEISETEAKLNRPDLSDSDIDGLRNRLEEIRAAALQTIEDLKPELRNFESRAEQLKQPEGGPQESQAIVEEREEVEEQLTKLNSVIQQLEVLALVASQVSGRAAEHQRTRFLQRIFEPGRSVIGPRFWIDGIANSAALYDRLRFIIKNWFQTTAETQTLVGWLARIGVLIFAWAIIWPLRLRVQRLIGPNLRDNNPSLLDRLWRAVYLPVTNVIAVAIAFGMITVLAVRFTDVAILRVGQIAGIGMIAFLWFVFLSSASRGVLAPGAPPWRLPTMSDALAVKLNRLLTLLAGVFAVNIFMSKVSSALFLPVEFTAMQGGILAALVTATMVAMLFAAGRGALSEDEEAIAVTVIGEPGLFSWIARLRWLLWLFVFVNISALILGYIALASFLSEQLIITGVLFAGAYLIHLLADEALTSGLASDLVLGKFVRRTFSMSTRAVERLGLVLITVTDVLLLLVVGPLLVLQWTVTWIDLKSWLTVAFFGFKIGDVTISPSSILIAVAVFAFVFLLTRFVVRWLDQRMLRRTKLDRGIRDSIRVAASYAGVIIAALIAASYAGLDFTNLAIVAGALSVGIGFGLQSIVNNFVSGLILLAERPIRVGDWIIVGTDEGTVRKINVRSTEIETFDRSTVIVPNSTLITGSVHNWTHRDKIGRLKIPVGVSYDADPERVEELLQEIAESESMVLRSPAPYVYFKDFGSSSLDFELRCYIFDVDEMLTVLSKLRFAIFRRLKEEGIEIPFPQRDIHLRDMDRIEHSFGAPAAAKPSPRRSRAKS